MNNIYFKKTLNHIVDNLEPKYKKIKHKIKPGETFNKIFEDYSDEKKEIIKIKNSLKKKVNIDKLNTKQIIQFKLDKTNNKINEFTFQISSTQKIILKKIISIKSGVIKLFEVYFFFQLYSRMAGIMN